MTPDLAGMLRIAGGLLFLAFILAGVLAGERQTPTTDWDALATDADEVDDYAGDIPPVIWSDAIGGYICATPAPAMPDEICGYPVTDATPCPDHGQQATAGAA